MAWISVPYGLPDEYRARNGRVDVNGDDLLTEYLTSVSRVVDKRLGIAPGHFAPQTGLTDTFTAYDSRLLRLRDETGRQYYLRTSTAIGIDSERDGTFDGYTLVLGTNAWVRGYPRNAVSMGEPYTALELLSGVTGASPSSWTDGVEVRIAYDGGFAQIPGAIKDRVIGITRELVEAHAAGGAAVLQDIDTAINLNPNARSLMHLLEQEYSRRIPSFA